MVKVLWSKPAHNHILQPGGWGPWPGVCSGCRCPQKDFSQASWGQWGAASAAISWPGLCEGTWNGQAPKPGRRSFHLVPWESWWRWGGQIEGAKSLGVTGETCGQPGGRPLDEGEAKRKRKGRVLQAACLKGVLLAGKALCARVRRVRHCVVTQQ